MQGYLFRNFANFGENRAWHLCRPMAVRKSASLHKSLASSSLEAHRVLSAFLQGLSAEAAVNDRSSRTVFPIGDHSRQKGDVAEFAQTQHHLLSITENYTAPMGAACMPNTRHIQFRARWPHSADAG
jgi:hypothetical protein